MNPISNSYEAHFVQPQREYGAGFLEDGRSGLWPREGGVIDLIYSLKNNLH